MANDIGKLEIIEITHEAKKAYLDYAMSVIVARALPDVRDGLKPVHRRILFAMHDMNLSPAAKFAKSAKIVGETMGKYHPHGDMPIYDALVRLAQDFSMRYPLVHGQGNFGSIDGDPAAAMRYCVTGDTLVATDKGLMPIKDISSDENISLSILSKDQKINHASKWFDSGIHHTLRITTKQGFSLQGTYNHPVLTWGKNMSTGKPEYTWKLLSQIVTGDTVVLDRSSLLWPKREISLEQYTPSAYSSRTQVKILPKTLNEDLAFILGSFLSEGTLNAKDKLEFCNSDTEWIREFETRWNRVFPDTRVHKFTRKPSLYGKMSYQRLEIHSLYVIQFLRNIGLAAAKSRYRTIPHLIFQSPQKVVRMFLKAYFEGDGSISKSTKMVELSCISVSEKLIQEMQIVLLRFGIVATKRFDRYRNTHKLYIQGLKNYRLFENTIGFISKRKMYKLREVIDSLSKDQSLLDYVPFLKEYVYENLDHTLAYEGVREFVYKHNFDRYSGMQLHGPSITQHIIPTLKPEIQKLFKDLIKNNYLFDTVQEITSCAPERVYSIKVDSTCHSFVANGFVNHNTEAKLTNLAMEMLWDIDKETVDFVPTFDGTQDEPVFLPSRIPNLLLMGSEGIAVGMATKIPPHNLGEVVDAVLFSMSKAKLEKKTEEATKTEKGETNGEMENIIAQTSQRKFPFVFETTIDELLEFIKGPDFPTGGAIYDATEIKNVYRTGRGKVLIRGIAEVEDIGQGKSAIIVRELPYQVNKATLVARIAELAKEKKLEGISDLRDESDRHGIRVVIELKRDVAPKKVLNNLFKHTALQTSFPANFVTLVDGIPRTCNLKVILEEYIKHRFSVVTRRSEFELRQAQARLHILDGLLIAVRNIEAVIKLIRESKSADDAKGKLMEQFKLSDLQAVAILDMQLRRLAALEREKLEDEWKMVKETIDYLLSVLGDPKKMLAVISEELQKIREKYIDERRTRVYKSKVDEFSDEDLIQNESTVITITKTGYIKRQGMMSFKVQKRGGKGISGMTTKEDDIIDNIVFSQTHDFILFFTNLGKVFQTRVFEIPESSRIAKGMAIANLIDIEQGESISSILTYNPRAKGAAKHVFLATSKGEVKKTKLTEFENIRKRGIVAIKIQKDDSLSWVRFTGGNDDILLVTKDGKIICFNEAQIRSTGRSSMGVRGIKLVGQDTVVGVDVISQENKEANLLVVAENGLGKKTKVSAFKNQHRGGQGVKVANINPKTGKIVYSAVLSPGAEEIIITSQKGQVVKIAVNSIPLLSRNAQGVILMRFSKANDKVASATCIEKDE